MGGPRTNLAEKPTLRTALSHSQDGNARAYTTNPDATLVGEAKARYVSGMFARIARRYDLMNLLMSFGQDRMWRRYTVRQARPPRGGLALDVATGTGRIAQELAHAGAKAVGIDFCLEMMVQGRTILDFGFWILDWPRGSGNPKSKIQNPKSPGPVYCAGADACRLPFADETFDCVTTGFAMRNVTDIQAAFREMRRVVKPGGRVVCLEVGRPRMPVVRFFHSIYARKVVPLLGRLVAGDADAYTYLPNSMREFPPPDELARIMRAAVLRDVRFKQLTFGAVAVHTGRKT